MKGANTMENNLVKIELTHEELGTIITALGQYHCRLYQEMRVSLDHTAAYRRLKRIDSTVSQVFRYLIQK